MKKSILFVSVFLYSLVLNAQKPDFLQAMGEALSQFATAKSVSDMQELGNKFQVIASAEPDQWLPLYYHAECYILMSFMEQADAGAKRDSYLDEAENAVNKLLKMAPNEAEVYVLQAFYYTGRLVINPMERGQEYSRLSGEATGKALELDPSNPRAQLMKLQMEIGSARFMGKDPKSFCPQAKELLAKWDNIKPKSPIYPNWGKDQLEGIIKNCE